MTNQLLVRYRDVKDCVDGDYITTIFSTNLGSEENQDGKSTKSGKLLFHLSENTWRCHLVACYPPIWPRPEHINKTRENALFRQFLVSTLKTLLLQQLVNVKPRPHTAVHCKSNMQETSRHQKIWCRQQLASSTLKKNTWWVYLLIFSQITF